MDLAARLTRDLIDLCAIRSEYGNERALADHVQARLERAGAGRVQRIGQSVVAGEPTGARPLIVLYGHLDTVPDAGNAWPPRLEGDLVYGLGASDMKAGLAVMLALAEEQVAPRAGLYDLGLVFYDKEEGPDVASGLVPALDACPWLAKSALSFCLEPTDGELHLGCLGGLHAKVTFRGDPPIRRDRGKARTRSPRRARSSPSCSPSSRATSTSGPISFTARSRRSRSPRAAPGATWSPATSSST